MNLGFAHWLAAEGASRDLLAWVESTGLDWPAIYDACPRADFLLAIAVRAGVDAGELVPIADALARRVAHDVDDAEVTAELDELGRCVASGASTDELASRAGRRSDAATDLVLSLAHRAIALAAETRTTPESVAVIPSVLVELAVASVMDCALSSVVGSTQHDLATLVRERLPASTIPIRW